MKDVRIQKVLSEGKFFQRRKVFVNKNFTVFGERFRSKYISANRFVVGKDEGVKRFFFEIIVVI